MHQQEFQDTITPEKVTGCVPCRERGHDCTAEVDLDTDRPMCRPCDVGIACFKDRLASGSHARSRAFPPLAALAASVKATGKTKPSPRKEKTLTPTNGKREEVKPQPVSATETQSEAHSRKPGRPRKDSSAPALTLTYSFEVISGAEYKARFKSVKYADAASLELLRVAVDKLKPGDRMIVQPKPGESLDSLRNKLCRTRDNYFANAAFKVIVSQDTANKHVALWRK